MSVAIAVESLLKTYKNGQAEIRAVDDVSFQIERGQFVALVGPSGSGKTTLLALLAGLLEPDAGQLWIAGQRMNQLSQARRTRFRRENIGFVFQDSHLVPYLTAQENVALMLDLNGRFDSNRQAAVKALLNRLGLAGRLHNLPRQLSGGQQQRVAIARALIHQPILTLADEPTASLDTERAYQVVQTLADLIHEQNRTGIMVTHDLRLCRFVDQVIQMVDGQVARVLTDSQSILALAETKGAGVVDS